MAKDTKPNKPKGVVNLNQQCVKCGATIETTPKSKQEWGKIHYGTVIKKSADNEIRQCQVDICPTCLNGVLGIL